MKKGDFIWHFNSRKISEKGISLVALVVTIVVSLIMVGMTVSMMTGNEGVLQKAETAVSESIKAEEMEKIQKAIINAIAENGTEGTVNVEKLKEELEGIVESTDDIEDGAKSWDVVGAQTGFTYRILEDGTMSRYEDENDIPSAELQSIRVRNQQITIAINAENKTAKILTQLTPTYTTEVLSYTSSNSAVASVDSNGVVTAHSIGTATITISGTSEAGSSISAVCTVTVTEMEIPLRGISEVTSELTIIKGNNATLTPTMEPQNATDSLVFESSNTSVATVSSSGVITAVNGGNATITVKGTNYPSITATCNVTVKVPLTGITMQESATIVKGNTLQLNPVMIPNTTTESLVYESSNNNIATVSSTGLIEAVNGGTATITAKGSESNTVTATCTVNVIVPLTNISVTSSTTLEKGEHLQLTPTKTPNDTTEGLTYESSNTSVATVSNTGEIIALGGGNATITVKGSTSTTVTATCNLTVKVTLTGIGNVPASASVIEDKTVTLTPSKTPVDSTESLTYESSNNSIATVSSSGVISGISAGTATITVKGNPSTGVTASCTVTVEPKLTSIENVPATATVAYGSTLTLQPSKTPPSAPESLTFTSSNNSIATVSNAGVITPVSAGSITITVRGSVTTSVYATCTLTVTTLTGIGNVPSTASLAPNGTLQLEPSKTPPDSTETLEYTTSNSSVATVSSSGLITGVAVGTATITVKGSSTTSVTATCVVTVSTTSGSTMTTQNRTLLGTTTGYSSKNPVIPQGFRTVNTTNATWSYTDSTNTVVTGWDNGLVITDDSNGTVDRGNEFVWVPCTDGAAISELVKFSKKDYTGYTTSQVTEATDTTTAPNDGNTYSAKLYNDESQVTRYGGFWVARYEASLPETTTTQSSSNNNVYTKIPQSKKNGKVWNYVDYTHSYVASQKMINDSTKYGNNKSGLITGRQWDTIMQWYEKASIDVGTSQTWGTYHDLEYTISAGKYFYSNNASSWSTASSSITHTQNSSPYLFHASGLNSNGYKKNIADMGGNMWEWTAEVCSSNRVCRGGRAVLNASAYPAGSRGGTGTTNDYGIGFRPVLYIQPEAADAGITMTNKNRTLAGTTSGYTSKNPVIPQGFRPVNEYGTMWQYTDSTNTEVAGWNSGLVITDDSNGAEKAGNEFVWVPCTAGSATSELVSYSRKNYTGTSSSSCSDATDSTTVSSVTYKAIPVTETTQISTYGGFWVARYEAGLNGSQTDNATSGANNNYNSVPVSKYGTKVWNQIDYTHSYVAAQKMINNSTKYGNNKSGLITGRQWDTIMQWYEKGSIDVGTTQKWGTYRDLGYSFKGNYFLYTGSAGAWQTTSSAITHTATTSNASSSNPYHYHGSGLNSNGYQKNIADLGGNVWEWTAEVYSSNRVNRGGYAHYGASRYPAGYRVNDSSSNTNAYLGFRPALYVQN